MRFRSKSLAICSLWLCSAWASAHSPVAGVNSIYDGFLHLFYVPSHLLLLVATGLFLGQQGARDDLPVFAFFIVAAFLGLFASSFTAGYEFGNLLLCLAALIGILVAIKPRRIRAFYGCCAVVAGLFVGLDSAQDVTEVAVSTEDGISLLTHGLAMTLGNALAIWLLLFSTMILAHLLNNAQWQQIAVRIAGSWIAASALMVLALALR